MSNTKKVNNGNKSNVDVTKLVFSVRGTNSVGTVLCNKYGLKQLTNTSHDGTQLIFSGKSSLNLRKKTCFINATDIDYKLLESVNGCELVENGNSVDKVRPHKVYFKFDLLESVLQKMSENTFNCNGFEIV